MSEKKKLMMINVTHAEESRVAIVTDGTLEAFEIETFDHKALKGNIYKGRVESVQPGLQAAFVDIGGARAGFLPLDEVNFKIHPPRKEGSRGRLENHLHKGQEILVQVVRDAYANKPPTLSTYFSLPGRFLVLTPFADSTGISRKLDDKQRERLRKALDSLAVPENQGVIVRTAGAAATKTELARDLKYLLRLWETIEEAAKAVRGPKLIYQERSLVIRTIRDLYTPDIDEILVDDPGAAEEIIEFFDIVLPQKKNSVKLYEGDRPLFNKYNLEEQIENIFRRRVPLPSGGAVIFDQTEALMSIDVNSGKMTHEGHIEDTALKANLEAAQEIARQMRLRDLGGLVVIDFIDMRASKNARQVEKVMKDALKKDKARYDVTRISTLGLMEISRERITAGKSSLRYTDCPTCDGTGSIKTVEAAAIQALRRLQTAVVRGDLENVEMTLPPEVAEYLLNQKRDELVGWEERYRTEIFVRSDGSYIRDRCDIRTVQRERIHAAKPMVLAPSTQEILAAVEADESAEEETAAATPGVAARGGAGEGGAAGDADKKRRRRRRGGRKHRKERDGANGTEGGEGEAAPAPGSATGSSSARGAARERGEAGEGEVDLEDFSTLTETILGDIYGEDDDDDAEDADTGPVSAGAGASGDGAAAVAGETAGEASERRRRRRRRRRRGGKGERVNGDAAGSPVEPASAEAGHGAPAPAAAPVAAAAGAAAAHEAVAARAVDTAPLAATIARIPEPGPDAPRPLWWSTLLTSAAAAPAPRGGAAEPPPDAEPELEPEFTELGPEDEAAGPAPSSVRDVAPDLEEDPSVEETTDAEVATD